MRGGFEGFPSHRTQFVHRAARGHATHDREWFTVADGAKLDLLGTVPRRRERRGEGSIGNPARVEGDQVVRPCGTQGEIAVVIDRATQSGSRRLRVTRGRGERELVFDTSDPAQVFRDQGRLPRDLGRDGCLL
jgi:hypothetical protein